MGSNGTIEGKERSAPIQVHELAVDYIRDGREALEPHAAEYPVEVVSTVGYAMLEGWCEAPDTETLTWLTGLVPELSGDHEQDTETGARSGHWNENRAFLAKLWIERGEFERGLRLLADATRYDNPLLRKYNPHACESDSIAEAFGATGLHDTIERALKTFE